MRFSVLFAITSALHPCTGADLFVDPENGDDKNDGRSAPLLNISTAVKRAKPGDTIHLAEGTYFTSIDLSNKHGEHGKPITIDGHGAILDGSEPVKNEAWEMIGPHLYRHVKLFPNTNEAIVARFFLLWDGEMKHMGRCSKGPSNELKEPTELKPGEWTYVEDEDAFYLKLESDQKLDEANIRYPARSSGVIYSRSGSWLTVKNITAKHYYNDGFNVHGAQRNLAFENIAAVDCGDDGFSAHEDADCRIDGFISIGNATGLCDTGTSETHYRDLSIKDCRGFDLYFIGKEHSVENAVIESSAARSFWLDGDHLQRGGLCRVHLKNVLMTRTGAEQQELRIGRGGFLHAENCTFVSLSATVTPGGGVDFRDCIFKTGTLEPSAMIFPNTIWRGEGNFYQFASLRVAQTSFRPETFPDFQKLTGSENTSTWSPDESPPDAKGADIISPESLKTQ